jgi:hypothetical protein
MMVLPSTHGNIIKLCGINKKGGDMKKQISMYKKKKKELVAGIDYNLEAILLGYGIVPNRIIKVDQAHMRVRKYITR